MTQLVYTKEELCRDHDYASPQVVAGHRLHGGFDADGNYVPPRTLVREPAIEAWAEALRERGGELLDADASLLDGVRYPSEGQGKLLLLEGLGQTFWNNLTITGIIEGRGRMHIGDETRDVQAGDSVVIPPTSSQWIENTGEGVLRFTALVSPPWRAADDVRL